MILITLKSVPGMFLCMVVYHLRYIQVGNISFHKPFYLPVRQSFCSTIMSCYLSPSIFFTSCYLSYCILSPTTAIFFNTILHCCLPSHFSLARVSSSFSTCILISFLFLRCYHYWLYYAFVGLRTPL